MNPIDLQALQQFGRSEHQHARHEKADKLYRLGSEYLRRAREDDPNDPDRALLRNAARCFSAAIENNRRDPRAYLQQAYLFLLTGNGRKAIRYLQEVQRLEPGNARARELLGYAQKQASTGARKTLAKPAGPPNPALLTRRRVEFIQELETVLERAFRETQSLQPTWARPVLEGYRKVQSEYNVGSSRVDLQACKLEYSIVSPK